MALRRGLLGGFDERGLARARYLVMNLEAQSEMGEIVKDANTGVQTTMLSKTASFQEQGTEFPGVRVPLEKMDPETAWEYCTGGKKDRAEMVAQMIDPSTRILDETFDTNGGEKQWTDRETQSERGGYKGPTGGSDEISEAGFKECSGAMVEKHQNEREGRNVKSVLRGPTRCPRRGQPTGASWQGT